jgi:hypothetical protein
MPPRHKVRRRFVLPRDAIAEHGWENFVLEWVESVESEEVAFRLEPKLIAAFNTQHPNSYNGCRWRQQGAGTGDMPPVGYRDTRAGVLRSDACEEARVA